MKFSIVLATMNRPQVVEVLLNSVIKQTFLPEEFVIVDQGADNKTREIFESYAQKASKRGQACKYIFQEKPSLVHARNRGTLEASGDIICFIDDDLILDENYFEVISSYFQDPSVGGVMGSVRFDKPPSGLKWEMRKILMRLFLLSNYDGKLTISSFGYPIYDFPISTVIRVELFSGYSMNFRKELVLRNKSDEWFSGYGFREDVDLSYRISKEAKLIMVPDARFIHAHSSLNRLDTKELKIMQFKNYSYMFRKFKKNNLLSYFLFLYSLSGLIFIDFLEWISGFKINKWQALKADFFAINQLLLNKS